MLFLLVPRVQPALAAVLALHVRQDNEGLLGFAVSRAPAYPFLSANVRLQLSSSSCAWTPGSPRTSCSQGSPFLPAGVRLALGPPWNEVASTVASRRYRPARTRGLLQLRGSLAAYRDGLALADAGRKRAPFVLSTLGASALLGLGASSLPAAAISWLMPCVASALGFTPQGPPDLG